MSEITFGRRQGGPRSPNPSPHREPTGTRRTSDFDPFSFNGRVRRRYYWGSQVSLILGCFAFTRVNMMLRSWVPDKPTSADGLLLLIIVVLALFSLCAISLLAWTNVSAVVRRWHDRGRSGWWALLGLIPLLGWLWQGIECGYLEGTLGPNRFGPSPKGIKGVLR